MSPRSALFLGIMLVPCLLTGGDQRAGDGKPVFTVPADAGRDSVVNVIVEFREPPSLLAAAEHRPLYAGYANRFAGFSQDLATAGVALGAAQLGRTYSRVFFGVSISLPARQLHIVEQLDYVKRVHRAKVFTADLIGGLAQIRVPEVRATFGVYGEGVRVGILDSGVDYGHPALGGGFGPGFKVAGGYDFVNGDPDPMDDYGHGTHVAGIVAADGNGLQGVAPKARLYAFKVLDQLGRGKEEDIIAAIEQCVDPNQDGDLSDKLQVVNMSLGASFGSPDDAISTAVDNASALGITFCVAAGNNGRYTPVQGKETNYYFTGMETVGSPGLARRAITVGAVDSLDQRASFSSQGPSSHTFAVKPDVLAPGVDIVSLQPGGGTVALSGTSMATPMVSGIAALLLERTPGLTPAEVKSLISTTARDLDLPVMAQGSGRVDAMRAFTTATLVRPTTLDLGLDDPAAGTWERAETLLVSNRRGVSQAYTVSLTGSRPGISLTASPPAFLIPAGGTGEVIVRVQVSNALVPIVDEDILVFDGMATITGTADTLRVPWAFVRTTRLKIAFSEPDPRVVGTSRTYYFTQGYARYYSKTIWTDSKHLEVIGASIGLYDIAAHFPLSGKLVVREQFDFQGSGGLAIDAAEAVHEIRFDARDEAGQPFPLTPEARRSLHIELPLGGPHYITLQPGSSTLLSSTVSTRFTFHPLESLISVREGGRIVLPQYHPFAGVSGPKVLQPGQAGYLRQTLKFRADPGVREAKLYSDIIAILTQSGEEYYNTVQFSIDTLSVANGEASVTLFLMPPVDPVFSASIAFHLNHSHFTADNLDLSTRYLTAAGDSIYAALPSDRSIATYASPSGGTMTFGGSPVSVLYLSYNNSFGTSLHFDPRFRGGLSEDRWNDGIHGSYEIFGPAGDRLTGGPLATSRAPFPVSPDVYTIKVRSSNHYVRLAKGNVEATLRVDITKPVPDPPYITSFTLLNGARTATDVFAQGENATLRFSSKTYAFPDRLPVADSTRTWYRLNGTASWLPLPVSLAGQQLDKAGSLYSADLSPATAVDSTGVDLRIRLVDEYGNATDHILEPAFAVGKWTGGDPTHVPESGGVPAVFALYQNYPNPFNGASVIEFRIPESGPVTLRVYDLLGREVATLVDGRTPAGSHVARFDASTLASGVYVYRLTAGGSVQVRKMTLVR